MLILFKIFIIFFIYLFDLDWLKFLPIILPVLLSVAFLTVMERKVLAATQRRRGPNFVGIFGLLQAIADALKLLSKESIVPFSSNFIIFIIAPLLTLILSLLNWSIIPFDFKVVISDIDLGLFFLLAFSSLGVHGIILSGWASNSKYSFLGSLRAAAQLISYEICLSIIILPVILYAESANLSLIVLSQDYVWNITILLPSFFLFFICILAETNRVPFDLPEAESELVSGYNVEYSAVTFVFFFLAEYSNILLMSSLTVCLFLGGWLPLVNFIYLPGYIWFVIKLCFIVFFFIWIRATLPRLRYDQLMSLGWKIVLPVSLFVFFFVTFILLSIRYILC